jgi:hypothetical protein
MKFSRSAGSGARNTPEGNGVFLVLCRQRGESLEEFDRRAEREIREAKQKAGSGKSFILRINGVLPRQGVQ